MKPNRIKAARFLATLATSVLVAVGARSAVAGKTDIATIPLVNASATTALPNIWFILDDSGSMAWRTIPGATSEFQFIPRATDFWASSHCNGLAYNPDFTYSKPPSQGSTTYNDASFTAACASGYGSCSTTDLTGSVYFTYSGSQPDLGFVYNAAGDTATANTFYNECNTASAKITVGGGTRSCSVTSVKVGTIELLSASTVASTSQSTVASRIAANVSAVGYTAMIDPGNNKQVLIYSNSASDATKTPTVSFSCSGGGSDMSSVQTAFPSAAVGPGLGKFTAVKLTASATAAQKANYANWYSYYRTRISMAKSSIGAAFQDIRGTPKSFVDDPADGDYFHARVGYTSLHDNSALGNLALGPFENVSSTSHQKKDFFDKLYGATASGGTPLRTALKAAGEMYMSTTSPKPIQYYCQRNNTILTTDGYWNDSAPSGIGNQDGGSTERPQYEGPTVSTASLADVAMYYYKTDLRPDLTGQLPEPAADANTKIDDVARHQHMTTFTVGMGVDGTLKYDSAYKTTADASTDFYKILNGTGSPVGNWPVPVADKPTAVDDLWHAAVNGRGTYFSAKNPQALAANLKQALSEMNIATGLGSANATGSLNPSPGADYGYTASYKTSDWTGDLIANAITSTGELSATVAWSAATELKKKIAPDGKTDTRIIFTGKTAGTLGTGNYFLPANISASDQAYFNNNQLNQYVDEWSATQKVAGTWEHLVNYLRGQSEYEIKSSATAQLYRYRKGAVLGDIVHSQPIYVGKPSFSFDAIDPTYATFKGASANSSANRGTVYVGANDGMLHAFNASDGSERWAFVPPMVYPNLWRLADRDYRVNHRYYVDGPIAVTDAKLDGDWKTVLVSGMGAGGRGYFAMDITTPNTPKLLWTFSADDNPNVGYSFGTPLIVKLGDTWVAVLASGYNNVPEGTKYATADGKGYVFVRDLKDGTEVKTIPTGAGTVTTPSGLATLNAEVKSSADYTARKAYGGDLTGTMYRFNLTSGTATKLIELGSGQPITSAPEIARPNGPSSPPLVYFGTGRYLGKSDLENTDPQYFYAVKDDGSTNVGTSQLIQHTLNTSGSLTDGTGTGTFGWYVNLPSSGERVHIHPQIQLGAVLFLTTIPSSTSADPCEPGGGTGWLYQLSYKNGKSIDNDPIVGIKFNSPPVGLVLVGTKNLGGYTDPSTADGRFQVNTGSGSTQVGDIKKPPMAGSAGKATRVQWRELLK
jgi:type IV pilus assembly protein PilY1